MRNVHYVNFALFALCANVLWVVACNNRSEQRQGGRADIQLSKPQGNGNLMSVNHLNNDNYSIAIDPNAHVDTRIDAALRLTRDERTKLQKELVKQLPGNLDRSTLDTVHLLGEIGDESAASTLKEMKKSPIDCPGKIRATITFAIDKITKRAKSKR